MISVPGCHSLSGRLHHWPILLWSSHQSLARSIPLCSTLSINLHLGHINPSCISCLIPDICCTPCLRLEEISDHHPIDIRYDRRPFPYRHYHHQQLMSLLPLIPRSSFGKHSLTSVQLKILSTLFLLQNS